MSKQRVCDICGRTSEQVNKGGFFRGEMTTFIAKGWLNQEEFDICPACLRSIRMMTSNNKKEGDEDEAKAK